MISILVILDLGGDRKALANWAFVAKFCTSIL